MAEILLDTVMDSIRLLPFLFFTYLLMELLEHHAGVRARRRIQTAGKAGPIWGRPAGGDATVRVLCCGIQSLRGKSDHPGNIVFYLSVHLGRDAADPGVGGGAVSDNR